VSKIWPKLTAAQHLAHDCHKFVRNFCTMLLLIPVVAVLGVHHVIHDCLAQALHSSLSHCCKLHLSCRRCPVSWLSDCCKLRLSCRHCWSAKQLRSAAACMLPHALHAVLCTACWAQQAQQPPILTPLPSNIASTTPSQVTHTHTR